MEAYTASSTPIPEIDARLKARARHVDYAAPPLDLDPEWVQFENTIDFRLSFPGTLAAMGQEMAKYGEAIAAHYAPAEPMHTKLTTKDMIADNNVPVRVYTPITGTGPYPLCIFFHGGGFCVGDLDQEDEVCRMVCESTESVVVSVDYRLAPAFPAPAPRDDCVSSVKWALRNAVRTLNAKSDAVYFLGGSAGGNLTVATYLCLHDEGFDLSGVRGLACLIPVFFDRRHLPAEYASRFNALTQRSDYPVLTPVSVDAFAEAHAAPATDKYHFPIGQYKDLSVLPRVYVAVSEYDVLKTDGQIFDECLEAAGVEHKFDMYEGLPHVFWIGRVPNAIARFEKKTADAVRWLLSGVE
ncbi:alpha/beta hydrolase fold-domain-containing protein [Limtongia smithiae]|uniref:alpha/beta hydrolase fold-domain-containing protein n=1 Tax=Limtongia smithiae TaxID=1125753 RepID=UPI0034CD66A2